MVNMFLFWSKRTNRAIGSSHGPGAHQDRELHARSSPCFACTGGSCRHRADGARHHPDGAYEPAAARGHGAEEPDRSLTNMVSLQEILANKQARGAFGQMRMETIVKDGLPKGAYTFQATLSNGKRPDCLLHMPNASAGVVIDAKFPLEGFEAFRTARREEEKKDAARRVRVDVGRHVDSMAERYFISGETQDTAILFVPSEAIYADLCEHFSDVVQKAHRARIVICAPNMLMLAVQTMQAILKDVQMREQAHLIQREVAKLMDDMGRFRERVLDLQRHFGQANADIEKILTSSDRIDRKSVV